VNTPAENPETTRPAKIGASDPAKTNRNALIAENASPTSSTGFRPISSDKFPNTSSPAITPKA
jgi:hypothetical protein